MTDKATQYSALLIASLSSFMTPFMISAINIALPSIEKEFKPDAILLSWVATSYLLAAAVALVPFGKLADIYGRKKIYLVGIFLFVVTTFLCAVAHSVWWLILFRLFQGAASAMIFATGIAIITSVFPAAERGRVLGMTVAAVYIGLSCGPFVGGWLTHFFGWRSIFLVCIPIGIAVILLILWKLKGEWAGAPGEKFDLTGSIIYAIAIVSIMYGISLMPSRPSIWILLTGLMALLVFVKWERTVKSPVFEVRLFIDNRVFAFSCLAALIHYSATFGVTFLLSLFLQYIKGLTPQAAGVILIASPVMMAIFSPLSGKLSDRIEPRIIASLGMGITAIGLILLTLVNSSTPSVFIVLSLMILGFGFALFSSPNMNAIMGSVEKRYYGIASGSVGTMRLLGQMFSMGIATLIFAVFIGRAQITPEYYPMLIKSVKTALAIFAGLCGAGIFFSLYRGELRPNSPPNR